MQGIADHDALQLQVIATGTHLSPAFGLTYRAIEEDGFTIDRRVEALLSSDSAVGVAKSMGLTTMGFAEALADLRPDVLVVLGDRFEMLAAVSAALVSRIPVAHIHGGEITEGAVDDAIRHAITKMSHLHFVAAEPYRARVIQLGEDPARVFNVGAVGIDSINRLQLLSREDLEAAIDFQLGERNLLVTYHPVTLTPGAAATEMRELLTALDSLPETRLIFTMPNADMEHHTIGAMVRDFVRDRPRARVYASLGQLRYLSCMKHVDAVVGNSSSGVIEAPALRTPSIDIGRRQRGRVKATSVVESVPEASAIRDAFTQVYSESFQRSLTTVENPYGTGGASDSIVSTLADADLNGILMKRFRDIE
jgi:GDP/UDP-N,N'-diacetylbacillosamine 2-epimerase (hydrolysing)